MLSADALHITLWRCIRSPGRSVRAKNPTYEFIFCSYSRDLATIHDSEDCELKILDRKMLFIFSPFSIALCLLNPNLFGACELGARRFEAPAVMSVEMGPKN